MLVVTLDPKRAKIFQMRGPFEGYHPLSASEADILWSTALVVVDTNVLLNMYRLSPSARIKLLSTLEAYSDRLWLPHQVGVEFHSNRVEEIRNQRSMGSKLLKTVESFKGAFTSVLQDYALNVDTGFLREDLEEMVETFSLRIKKASEDHAKGYGVTPQSDPILMALEVLYDEKIGVGPSGDWLKSAYVEAEARYADKVPPGFKDAKNKSAPRKYGDYIIWSQILQHAKDGQHDVLFVTDDKKSDWWWESEGETLGPDPRLRNEFRAKTGRLFYAYRSDRFVRLSDERQSVATDEKLISEIRITGDVYADRERVAADMEFRVTALNRHREDAQRLVDVAEAKVFAAQEEVERSNNAAREKYAELLSARTEVDELMSRAKDRASVALTSALDEAKVLVVTLSRQLHHLEDSRQRAQEALLEARDELSQVYQIVAQAEDMLKKDELTLMRLRESSGKRSQSVHE